MAKAAGQQQLPIPTATAPVLYSALCSVHPTILTADAIDLLATKLRTPLQIQLHLTLALDVGYHAGEQPISADLVESVLSKQLNDLEPTLTRHGYRVKDLVEQFDARPAELKALFNNQLDPTRTAE